MNSTGLKAKMDKLIAAVLVLLMAVMVCNVSWQVISRYILKSPSSFTDELSRYMLIWLGMLGAAYVAGQDKHLAIDILPKKLNGKPRARLQVFIHLVLIVFVLAVLIFGGSNLVYITYILGQKSATLQIPLAYIYTIVPLSGFLMLYYQVHMLLKTTKYL
jgi:TRAP-type C4-dicarboxylate transport system permease small subunit